MSEHGNLFRNIQYKIEHNIDNSFHDTPKLVRMNENINETIIVDFNNRNSIERLSELIRITTYLNLDLDITEGLISCNYWSRYRNFFLVLMKSESKVKKLPRDMHREILSFL